MPAADLEALFPNLRAKQFNIKSPKDEDYNCIGWAAHDRYNRWWPNPYGYWPVGVDREETIDCFVRAFETLGYKTCEHERLELGYEKVAIYVLNGIPTHMARQRFWGGWTSKVGSLEDIVHSRLEQIESAEYGRVAHFMERGLLKSLKVRLRQLIRWKY